MAEYIKELLFSVSGKGFLRYKYLFKYYNFAA